MISARQAMIGAIASAAVIAATPTDAFYSSVGLLAEMRSPRDKSQYDYNTGLETSEEQAENYARDYHSLYIPLLPENNTTLRQCVSIIDTTFPNLGNSDFTIECWVRRPTEPSQCGWITRWGASGYFSWRLYWDATNNRVSFQHSLDGTTSSGNQSAFDIDTDGSSNLWNGEWHHVAAVRYAGVIKVYVDGVAGSTTQAIGSASIFASSGRVAIGAILGGPTTSVSETYHDGWMDDVRITIGAARYTANFTPEEYVRGAADPYWTETKLLLDFEDSFGADWVSPNGKGIDKKQRVVQPTPLIVSKGLETTTSSTWLNFQPATDWSPGSGDFCIEVFNVEQKSANAGAIRHIAGAYGASGSRSWRIVENTSGQICFYYSNAGSVEVIVNSTFVPTVGTPYNVCVERAGSTLRIFINGTQMVSTAMSVSVFAVAANWLSLGGRVNGYTTSAEVFNGFIRAIRYTYAARYNAASYTVPSLPLPRA